MLPVGQNLKMAFRRHYIREIVARYNNRASRDVQLRAIQRRRAATAMPIADPNDPQSSNRTPEFIAPSKDDLMRPISVDMVTPYQGRLVLESNTYEISLEDIDEGNSELSGEKQMTTTPSNEIVPDEYRNTFHGRPSHLGFKPNLEFPPGDSNESSVMESSNIEESFAVESLLDEGVLGESKEFKSAMIPKKKKSSKGLFPFTLSHDALHSNPCRLACSNS